MKPYPLYTHPALKDFRQLLDWRAGETPNNDAFQYRDKSHLVSVTYAQFRTDVDELAAFFHAQGFEGTKIAILGENSYQWILTYFASVLSSNIIVPIDKELPTGDMIFLLQRCGAKVLAYSPGYEDVGQAAHTDGAVNAAFNMVEFPAILESQRDPAPATSDENAICAIIYTSGTTGEPKGVMLTQKSLMADTLGACKNAQVTGASLLTLPLHHTFAFTTSVLAMLVYGVPICINKSLRTFQADMKAYQPQNMFLVPLYVETLYKGLWKAAREQKRERLLRALIKISNLLRKCGLDLRRKLFRTVLEQFGGNLDLIICGGAFLEQSYIDGMEDIGVQVLNGYGITECSPVVAVNRNRWAKPGSIGLPLPCCKVQIQDGEICVKREKNTAGMFVNTAPLLIELDNAKTFGENLEQVMSASFEVFRHQKYNYGDLLSALRREYGFTGRLYDVMVSYQNAAIAGETGGFESTWYHSGAQAESLQIHIDDRDSEGIFRIHFDFQTEKFTEAEIDAAYTHMMNLLFDSVEHEDAPIRTLEMLSPAERHKMLVEFNDTVVEYPREKCVHQLFEEQVEKTPDKTAVVACDRTLTYRELNEAANRIAHGLIAKGVCPGDIVAFALHRTSRFIAAMFGILKAGAAYLPIDLDYPKERIDYMLSDSGAKLLLTDEVVAELLKNEETVNPVVAVSGDNLFCALHTSGSTGKPKLSLLKQQSLSSFLAGNCRFWEGTDTVVSTTIVTFDAFMLETVLPLAQGYQISLAKEDEIYNQSGFEKLFFHSERNMMFSTPTKIENYIDGSPEKRLLKRVKSLVVGGEIFSEDLLTKIKKHSENCKVYNIYGPTETTICASVDVLELRKDITIGKPIANTQIYIVDKYLSPVPMGVTGELCIAGDGVGAGYLNRRSLTAEKFIENPFGPGKLYKTGDLAYWREDGNIVYVGRSDFQVKVRGLRIELGEIEAAISAVEGISQAVVVVRKDDAGRQLICAFYTETNPVSVEWIESTLREKLPRYMLPHVFTRLDALPMTPSGKIDRKALPEVDFTALQSETEYIAPTTPEENALTSAIQAVLGVERVGLLDNFFDQGGDSLKAIELIAKLEKAGLRTDTKTIFACETVRELAAALVSAVPAEEEEVPTGDIPATAAQLRVYTAQNMQGGTAYNVPYVFKTKSVDPERLQAAVSALIDRHEILRTHFENWDGEIMQVAEKTVPFTLQRLESDDISAFVQPFDLSKAPLLRVGYFENTIMVDLHHIITDGSSMPVFLRELNELYVGRELKDSPVQYRVFAARKQDATADENYWLSVYREELPELALNTDFKRGQKQSYRGAAVYDSLDGELHKKILAKCKALNVTPYVFYLGGFYVLLSKFSGNEDIAVGTPASGREGKFLNTLGMFVNTLAIRNKPEGEKSVQDFLLEVKENSLAALEHQVYPYGDLVKKLGLQAQGRNPLFGAVGERRCLRLRPCPRPRCFGWAILKIPSWWICTTSSPTAAPCPFSSGS